jgi:hypothetical protein
MKTKLITFTVLVRPFLRTPRYKRIAVLSTNIMFEEVYCNGGSKVFLITGNRKYELVVEHGLESMIIELNQ